MEFVGWERGSSLVRLVRFVLRSAFGIKNGGRDLILTEIQTNQIPNSIRASLA